MAVGGPIGAAFGAVIKSLVDDVTHLWHQDLPDADWVVRFLKSVGSDPDQFAAPHTASVCRAASTVSEPGSP